MPKRALVLHFLLPFLGLFLDLTIFRYLQNVIGNNILNLVSSLFLPLFWFFMYTLISNGFLRSKERGPAIANSFGHISTSCPWELKSRLDEIVCNSI